MLYTTYFLHTPTIYPCFLEFTFNQEWVNSEVTLKALITKNFWLPCHYCFFIIQLSLTQNLTSKPLPLTDHSKMYHLNQEWVYFWRNSLNLLKKTYFGQNYQINSLLWDRLVWNGCTEYTRNILNYGSWINILCVACRPHTQNLV